MKIPKNFKIAGGKLIKVDIHSELEEGKFGDFSPARNTIRISRQVEEDGQHIEQNEEDMLRTFLHELFHCFQWYYNTEFSEEEAQTYSNFLYEFLNTKE